MIGAQQRDSFFTFSWCHAHVDIHGNEDAEAVDSPEVDGKMCIRDRYNTGRRMKMLIL